MFLSSAGHHPPLHRRGNLLLPVEVGDGIPLGILEGSVYQEREIDLKEGDLFLFYTDGLLEARNPAKEEFGMERVRKIVESVPCDADRLIDELLDAVNAFMKDAPRHDDLTLVAAKLL